MIEGLIAVVTSSFEVLASRKILSSGKFKSEKFIAFMFLGVILILAPFMFWIFRLEKLNLFYVSIFIGILFSATIYNFLQFKALKRINVENAEPIILSSWIFTILLGFMFIPSERNLLKIILATIACLTLIATEIKGNNFKINKWELIMIISSIFIGIYNLLTKIFLDVTNPFTLYWIRTIFLFPLFFYISKFKLKDIKSYKSIFLISLASIISQVSTLWAYSNLGLIFTSLLMNLTPILTLLGASIFLKEKIQTKNIVSSIIIILCIILGIILN